ncbi:MAG: radical SAM protein [Planctomycetota bacterium]
MRVLFLEIDTEGTWAVASIGPAFIAAYLRQRGHEASFLRVPQEMTSAEVVARVREHAPGLLGLSLTTRQWQRARALVRDLRREVDVPVVAGGLHPTFSGEEVLASEGFDYVCLGEGEEPMGDLVAALERGATPFTHNIWRRGQPKPPLRKPIEPLDALPFMARDFLDERWGVRHMTTQRGCPFPCTYCAARKYEDLYEGVGDYGRRRSHESVIAELEALDPLSYVIFLDDTFTIHHPWVKAYCKLHAERVKVGFSLHARVETVDKDLLACLAKAGCKHIVYGVESGSERVRREIMHRPVTNERFRQVFQWTREVGIISTANYMLGLPGETAEDIDRTLALHEEIKPDDFGYFVFYPYPGTALFHTCKEKGYLPDDYLERPAHHRASILNLPDLTQEAIARAYDRFTEARERSTIARYTGTLDESQRKVLSDTIKHAASLG